MNQLVENIIEEELKQNKTFDDVFKYFEVPKLDGIKNNLDLTYEANEYMGYYKKDLYYELKPKIEGDKIRGTLKISFVSNRDSFDIKKALQKNTANDINNVSATFRIYNSKDSWDAIRYSYTLWKNN